MYTEMFLNTEDEGGNVQDVTFYNLHLIHYFQSEFIIVIKMLSWRERERDIAHGIAL